MHRDPAEERPEAEDMENKDILVIGCGNVLLGDDGLGPAAVKYLEAKGGLPRDAGLVDAGTGIRKLLFNIVLAEKKPKRIVIIDAIDAGKKPGEVFEIDLEGIPAVKSDDFSMHQIPTSNMLKELRDECGVDVRVIAVQVESIPSVLKTGLSAPVAAALDEVRRLVIQRLKDKG
ncbi:MAG: hydrogenase maturation protease [Elusimicrobia bacterium]|nr:hydrogenase maturation protease [Elusimicrobiota bacterium]